MAKTKSTLSIRSYFKKPKVKRPGVHSKKKTSRNKKSKNYKKLNIFIIKLTFNLNDICFLKVT